MTHLHNNIFWFLLFYGGFRISFIRKCWSKGIEYLLHLVQTLSQILIKIGFHSGHYPLQLDPFIQQLPVVLNVDKQDNTHTQKSVDVVRLMSRAKRFMWIFSMNVTKDHIKISPESRPEGSDVACKSNIKLMTQPLQKMWACGKINRVYIRIKAQLQRPT